MGDSISEGSVQEWVVPEGGQVNAHDTVCTLETEKVTQPVYAPVSGKVVKHLAALNEDVSFPIPNSVSRSVFLCSDSLYLGQSWC